MATALIVFFNYIGDGDIGHLVRLEKLWHSLHLFDAITCGTPGPISRYLSNVKKSGRRAADFATQERRSFFVGLVLALEHATLSTIPSVGAA